VVLITSGVNEKAGGARTATIRKGGSGCSKKNALIYRDIVPQIVRAAPKSVLVAVTDPPDPLADIAREAAGHGRVLSTGTFIDSPSLLRTSRKIFRRGRRTCGGASDRRSRYVVGFPVVVCRALRACQ